MVFSLLGSCRGLEDYIDNHRKLLKTQANDNKKPYKTSYHEKPSENLGNQNPLLNRSTENHRPPEKPPKNPQDWESSQPPAWRQPRLTGSTASPSLFEVIWAIGQTEVLARLRCHHGSPTVGDRFFFGSSGPFLLQLFIVRTLVIF